MNKEDLIYDAVCRLEERFDKELLPIRKDLDDLKTFKNRVVGMCLTISLVGSFIIDSIKSVFLR